MANDSSDELERLLSQLESQAAARIAPKQQGLFRSFLRHYYELASLETLKQRTPAELLEIAEAHWTLARSREPGATLIAVTPPQDATGAGSKSFAAIQTVADDMPFLYDTISMAVRAAGSAIDWTVHPVLRVQRDKNNTLSEARGTSSNTSGLAESLVHIEFDALPSASAYTDLEQNLRCVLEELRTAVQDYPVMRQRVAATVEILTRSRTEQQAVTGTSARNAAPGAETVAESAEAAAFLRWLEADHFTFLGYVECAVEQAASGPRIGAPGDGLGLLRAGSRYDPTFELMAPQDELNKYAGSSRVVVITKSNIRSPVHHPEYMDVISVKLAGDNGQVYAIRRFTGLFASEVYSERPGNIPLVRSKVSEVLARSRLPEHSHSGKNLRAILHGLPRDELFQSSEDELFRTCMGIRALRDRKQLRLFMRRDRYGRFYSCLVYVPRERYSRELRDRVAAELLEVFGGLAVEHDVEFLRGGMARVHVMIRTRPGTQIAQTAEEVERRLIEVTRSWRDQLRETLLAGRKPSTAEIVARFSDAFPADYTAVIPPAEAAADVHYLAQLSAATPLLPRLSVATVSSGDAPSASAGDHKSFSMTRSRTEPQDVTGTPAATLKLYSHGKSIALSDVLPTLENFGLHVIRQEPSEIKPKGSESLWVQEFDVGLAGADISSEARRASFEAAFLKTWHGEYENDGLNRLVLGAGLEARQVVCLRTILKYLIQSGLPYSQAYMEQLLADHAVIARLLVKQFETKFDPHLDDKKRKHEELKLAQELDALLDKVATLDGDRVLRAFLSVVRAALRTNYFQPTAAGQPKHYVSIKLDPKKVPELPQPLPMFEIFVYAPEVEGIHLRGGKVARGGLRWSDRRQDFRTEVLGLMKAQQVKNAIIVPVGAKGGFVLKRGDPANREEWLRQGVECYKTFLRGLLDITDNRVGDKVIVRPNIVRYDEDDPYLVVAADKGTATFSDIANALSAEYEHWLGDAFASGGSVGYDHKKMGITAKGAWESVQRHFREVGKDIQNEEFTAVGVGDMSGDVFGNGMLLSRKIKLLAAFDHRHIFLDPSPDPEISFKERERMFKLPRSSWDDYNKDLISKGGGIYPRSSKLIKLSSEMQKALDVKGLDLKKGNFTPNELMNTILKSPVDLLWNGGIGTYVKSQHQSHQDCGDRANDGLRVNGRELRCKVVGEGGNLGCTQLGRIEYALAGGKLNTDFIDNAGGVHSSDREVNIKIPLNGLMQAGKLKREVRDPLLAKLTGDVASGVLRDNYVQCLAISLLERDAAVRMGEHADLMRTLERDGLLNRTVEFLPDDEALNERRGRGKGLTRPELAVLISYSKISLFDALLNSEAPDDPFFNRDLLEYFPPLLVEKYKEPLLTHRLRREIIATILSNAVVNRMGIAFAHLFAEHHGLPHAEVVKAYAIAHEIFDGDRYWAPIQALDGKIPSALQLKLFGRAIGLMKHATTWLLTHHWSRRPIGEAVSTFRKGISELTTMLPDILPPSYRGDWDKAVTAMEKDGTPHELATHLANTMVVGSAPDIVELAHHAKVPLKEAASVYFQVGDRLRVLWLLSSIIALQVQGKWQALARHNLREDTYQLHRQIAGRILEHPGKTPEERLEHWTAANEATVKFGIQRLQELQAGGVHDFMTLAVGVRELRKLRML